jgi:hypothetical protein
VSHLDQLGIERRRAFIRGKALLVLAYLFSAGAGVAALAVPTPGKRDEIGVALTYAWGAFSLAGALLALVAVFAAARVLRGHKRRRDRFLIRLEVPGLRILAVANALYALSIGVLMIDTGDNHLMPQMLTAALPAWLYWQEMRRLNLVLREWRAGQTVPRGAGGRV